MGRLGLGVAVLVLGPDFPTEGAQILLTQAQVAPLWLLGYPLRDALLESVFQGVAEGASGSTLH